MSSAHRFAPLEGDEARKVEKAIRLIEAFRTLEPGMSAAWINAFLAVAYKPGYGPTHYAKECGTIQPIMSRILLELGPKNRSTKGPGLQLIDRVVDDESLRSQRYFLTAKGKQLLNSVLKNIE